MAPSPVIPTSFVPKQPVRAAGQYSKSGGNLFLLAAIILLAVALLGGAGVFAYERFLTNVREEKRAEVERAEEAINAAAVEDFVRTRDRFLAAGALLDGHVAASQFFALLESLTLQNVRFNTLSFELADDRSARIQMAGNAATFNALAAQSSALASESRIKRAIFSDIDINDTSTVSFTLTADLSPALLKVAIEDAVPAPLEETLPSETILPEETIDAPIATSTATTTP